VLLPPVRCRHPSRRAAVRKDAAAGSP
jgi:hypothetical protein